MSIPPLVCSTPPPPDQCEDDREPEDLHANYNLSQEEDDFDDYGSFSTYNNFQSSAVPDIDTTILSTAIPQSKEITKDLTVNDNEVINSEDLAFNRRIPNQDDIEDLELELSVPQLTFSSVEEDMVMKNDENVTDEDSDLTLHIEKLNCNENDQLHSVIENSLDNESNDIQEESPSLIKKSIECTKTICLKQDSKSELDIASIAHSTKVNLSDVQTVPAHDNNESKEDESKVENISRDELSNLDNFKLPFLNTSDLADDGFGDFDNFKFDSQTSNINTDVVSTENPWNNSEENDNLDFGNFQANFDEIEKYKIPSSDETEHSNVHKTEHEDEEDDFGDFDDFKSSEVKRDSLESPIAENCSMFSLYSPENEEQLIENIKKVLENIFDQEIEQPEDESCDKLESRLCETWGYLVDTDMRQPYIVNWNNSASQKTLLRSLCIDSRNILFAPKWSYSAPRFAATLSAAPLQPAPVPAAVSAAPALAPNRVPAVPAPVPSWPDPFASHGQESSNLEVGNSSAASNFTAGGEGGRTTVTNKLYACTPSLQPIRQISLPDTHIYTPTDSETPRSQTIHYDSGPSVLIPKVFPESNPSKNPQPIHYGAPDDDFQDFKASFEPPTPKPPEQTKPNVTMQTQILQPIKMEVATPIVNWPEPGDVKVFDDFTDFVSNNPSCNIQPPENKVNSVKNSSSALESNKVNVFVNNNVERADDGFDDDFDTFKSAAPSLINGPSSLPVDSSVHNRQDSASKLSLMRPGNADNSSSYLEVGKVSGLPGPFNSIAAPLNPVTVSEANKSKVSPSTGVSGQFSSTLGQLNLAPGPLTPMHVSAQLNPLPRSAELNKPNIPEPNPRSYSPGLGQTQNSGQILQPLSLESFSQINWPSPGLDLQDLSRFNPVETLRALNTELGTGSPGRRPSPAHSQKGTTAPPDDDVWGEFVSSQPPPPPPADDDEWTEFVCSPGLRKLNTISLNVSHAPPQPRTLPSKPPCALPTLDYVTPRCTRAARADPHFQNL